MSHCNRHTPEGDFVIMDKKHPSPLGQKCRCGNHHPQVGRSEFINTDLGWREGAQSFVPLIISEATGEVVPAFGGHYATSE